MRKHCLWVPHVSPLFISLNGCQPERKARIGVGLRVHVDVEFLGLLMIAVNILIHFEGIKFSSVALLQRLKEVLLEARQFFRIIVSDLFSRDGPFCFSQFPLLEDV